MIETKPNNGELNPDPYYSEVHATFGDRLCAARDAAGLNQSMLAEKIGVKLKTVQAWESDSIEPRANKLQMVAALLNVSMVWLMSGLGKGIAPPEEPEEIIPNDTIEILKELRSIRSAGENILKRIAILDKKIAKKSKTFQVK